MAKGEAEDERIAIRGANPRSQDVGDTLAACIEHLNDARSAALTGLVDVCYNNVRKSFSSAHPHTPE